MRIGGRDRGRWWVGGPGAGKCNCPYGLNFSGIVFLRVYIHSIVYIVGYVNMFNLCFGFDLAWFGPRVGEEYSMRSYSRARCKFMCYVLHML